MPAAIPISEQMRAEIVRRYVSGETYTQISKWAGFSHPVVAKVVRQAGVRSRVGGPDRALSPAEEVEVPRLYDAGKSKREIAAMFGCSEEPIRRIILASRRAGQLNRAPHGTFMRAAQQEGDRIVSEYRAGNSRREIALMLGYPIPAIQAVLEERGEPLRDDRTRQGSASRSFKGGRCVDPEGYIKVKVTSSHPMITMATKGRYILEHRLVVAESLGRPLYDYERVHHRNGNRHDNRLENLELWEYSHPPGQRAEEAIGRHCPSCTCRAEQSAA